MVDAGREDDIRFRVPLYTVREAALYLGVPPRTFNHWVRGGTAGTNGKPLITTVEGEGPHSPTIPFIGFAEGLVIATFRRVEMLSMQYVHRALELIDRKMGIPDALASKRLYLHGGQLLFNHADELGDQKMLAEIITENLAFNEVVEKGLRLITYDNDYYAYARRAKLPGTPKPVVEVDPYRASGKPVTIRGGIRVVDILDRFRGRESPDFIAMDFGVPEDDVLDILRAFYSPFSEAA